METVENNSQDSNKPKQGIIYMLTMPDSKAYIGQTTSSLEIRFAQHKRSKKNYEINKAFNKHGSDNIKKEVLLMCNVEHLDQYESKFINMYNTLWPNGLNCDTGGKVGKKTTLDLMINQSQERKNDDNKDLPMYIHRNKNNPHKHYSVGRHPKCQYKSFHTKEEAIDFLEKLESGEVSPVPRKTKPKKVILPEYIFRNPSGGYDVIINNTRVKSFTKRSEPLIDRLNKAIDLVKNLKDSGEISKYLNKV